jgi:CRP-like cAMP-binding protein
MFSVFRQYVDGRIKLTEEEFQLIESVCTFKKLRRHQFLLQEGDVWRYNAFICAGIVRAYKIDDKGQEHILHFAMENWWTGDRESLTSGQPSQLNIDALDDAVILLINKENFEMICDKIPAFNKMVNQIINNSFITLQNRLNAAISYTAEEKYRQFLEKSPGLALRVPQQMIASYLGITPETLSRIKKQITKRS